MRTQADDDKRQLHLLPTLTPNVPVSKQHTCSMNQPLPPRREGEKPLFYWYKKIPGISDFDTSAGETLYRTRSCKIVVRFSEPKS